MLGLVDMTPHGLVVRGQCSQRTEASDTEGRTRLSLRHGGLAAWRTALEVRIFFGDH